MALDATRQSICARSLTLARSIAERFSRDDDEFESVAVLALCESVANPRCPETPTAKYLSRCIINRLKDHLRNERRRREVPLTFTLPAPQPRQEAPLDVCRTLSQVSPTQRHAIKLSVLEGLSGPEGAALCGCSRGAFQQRVTSGLAKLRLTGIFA